MVTLILTGALFLATDVPKASPWGIGIDGPTATLIAVLPTLLVGIATLILSSRIAGVSADLARVNAIIASQQLETAKNKLRLDLFEKRYAAFEAALKLVSITVQKGNVPDEARREFVIATRGVEFLFDRELQAYCDTLAKEALNLRWGERMLETLPVSEQRTRTAEAWPERMKWFTEQMEEIPKRFGPFLKIEG